MAPWRGEELEGDRALEEEPGTPQGPTATPSVPEAPSRAWLSLHLFLRQRETSLLPYLLLCILTPPLHPSLVPQMLLSAPCLEGSSYPFSHTVKMCPARSQPQCIAHPHHSSLGERRRQAWGLLLES